MNACFVHRQIVAGSVCLRPDEKKALGWLLAIFSQHCKWSLSAVVAFVSRHFHPSTADLLPSCTEFLLGEDGNYLADFLSPLTWIGASEFHGKDRS